MLSPVQSYGAQPVDYLSLHVIAEAHHAPLNSIEHILHFGFSLMNLGVILQREPLGDSFTACDLWVQCMGSDHCPVWATLDVPQPELPKGFLAPALSTSHMLAGELATRSCEHARPTLLSFLFHKISHRAR